MSWVKKFNVGFIAKNGSVTVMLAEKKVRVWEDHDYCVVERLQNEMRFLVLSW